MVISFVKLNCYIRIEIYKLKGIMSDIKRI